MSYSLGCITLFRVQREVWPVLLQHLPVVWWQWEGAVSLWWMWNMQVGKSCSHPTHLNPHNLGMHSCRNMTQVPNFFMHYIPQTNIIRRIQIFTAVLDFAKEIFLCFGFFCKTHPWVFTCEGFTFKKHKCCSEFSEDWSLWQGENCSPRKCLLKGEYRTGIRTGNFSHKCWLATFSNKLCITVETAVTQNDSYMYNWIFLATEYVEVFGINTRGENLLS